METGEIGGIFHIQDYLTDSDSLRVQYKLSVAATKWNVKDYKFDEAENFNYSNRCAEKFISYLLDTK